MTKEKEGMSGLIKIISDDRQQQQIMKYFKQMKESFCFEHMQNPVSNECDKCKTMISNLEAIRMLAYISLTIGIDRKFTPDGENLF